VTLAQVSTSPDRRTVVGIADDGNFQAYFRYNLTDNTIYAVGIVASPKPLPRVSVSADGSWSFIGQYKLDPAAGVLAQFPNSITSQSIGGNAIDSKQGLMYAQILTLAPATNFSPFAPPPSNTSSPPVLVLMDAENLTVKESLKLPENITGRMTMNAAADVVYA